MRNNIIETIMGAVVLIVAAFFIGFAYKTSGIEKGGDVTQYTAMFDRIDGLVLGADVRMSGVKVGVVTKLEIDPKTYLAKVAFTVKDSLKIPKDSSAEIVSDGLMGSKYLTVVAGGDDENIPPGGAVVHTQSAVNLESLIGQLIFSNKKDKGEKEKE